MKHFAIFFLISALCCIVHFPAYSKQTAHSFPTGAQQWEYGKLRCESLVPPDGSELVRMTIEALANNKNGYEKCTWKTPTQEMVGDTEDTYNLTQYLCEMPDNTGEHSVEKQQQCQLSDELHTKLGTGEYILSPFGPLLLLNELMARESPNWKRMDTFKPKDKVSPEALKQYQRVSYYLQAVELSSDYQESLEKKNLPAPDFTVNGILNLLGSKGWEVVNMENSSTNGQFVKEVTLKRPVSKSKSP